MSVYYMSDYLSIDDMIQDIVSLSKQEQEKIDTFDAEDCNLKYIPNCIRLFVNLKKICANENLLETLPVWLDELPLEELYLGHNNLKEFPFFDLPYLEILSLDGNNITKLPCSVRNYPLDE